MTANHTPGPWAVLPEEADKDYLRIRGTRLGCRYKVANVHMPRLWESHYGLRDRENAESLANARLIAAAPEMLDALDGLAAQVRPLWAELDIDGFRHSALKEAYDFACKVAGKAKGEPQ